MIDHGLDPDSDSSSDSIQVKVKTDGVDVFGLNGRVVPPKISVTIRHYDDYGILVIGTSDRRVALRALKKVGYDMDIVKRLSWRPTMVDQCQSKWPFGLWVGGTEAFAFYFQVGPAW